MNLIHVIPKLVNTSEKYMLGRSRWWIGNPPDPHRSTPEYSRSSFEHSAWLYRYLDLFQSFVIIYLSTLIYFGAFYWIVEHPYLFQRFSFDRWVQLPDLISTYLTLIILDPIYILTSTGEVIVTYVKVIRFLNFLH